MNYKFDVSLPDSLDFRAEFAVGGEQTFQQFHDKIVEAFGYDASQIASFYTLDKMGNRVKEIALMDMSEEEDSNTLVMDSTKIEDIISASCIELEYIYDFFNNKYFRVEYSGEYIADSADVLPVCLSYVGEIPQQDIYGGGESWMLEDSDDEYDDSFMEEFSDYSEKDDLYSDDDEFEKDDFDDDDFDKYQSIDDYIDKL